MARDLQADYLDAQWHAFLKDLNEAFSNARAVVGKVAADEPGNWQFLLSHVKWENGEPMEIGIAVVREQRRGDPHVN